MPLPPPGASAPGADLFLEKCSVPHACGVQKTLDNALILQLLAGPEVDKELDSVIFVDPFHLFCPILFCSVLFSTVLSRGNGFEQEESSFRMNIRKMLFTMRVVRHWHSLPREMVDASSLETFKIRLNGALSSISYL